LPSDPTVGAATAQWFASPAMANGAFARMITRGMIRPVPMRGAIGVATTAFTGFFQGEGKPMVFQRISVSRDHNEGRIASALAGISDELATATDDAASALIGQMLGDAVNFAIDRAVFDTINNSTTGGEAASGTDAGASQRDARTALRAVFSAGQPISMGVWICDPLTAISLATLGEDDGGPAIWPDVGVSGGSICGLPLLVSSGWPQGCLSLLDGSQAVGAINVMGLRASRVAPYSAALAPMQDLSTGASESLISSFQSHSTLLASMTRYTFELARGSAAFTLYGCDAYETAAS